jgi:hypothetical protein
MGIRIYINGFSYKCIDDFYEKESTIKMETNILEGKNYVIGIGITEYQIISNLKYSVKYVKDTIDILKQGYNFSDSCGEYALCLYNEDAKYENILDLFSIVQQKLKEEDVLIIVYCGHGEIINNTYVWATHDSLRIEDNKSDKSFETNKYIEQEKISSNISKIKCKKVLLVNDTCFSNKFLNFSHKKSNNNNVKYKDFNNVEIKKKYNTKCHYAICAGPDKIYDKNSITEYFYNILILNGLNSSIISAKKDSEIFYLLDGTKIGEDISRMVKGDPQRDKLLYGNIAENNNTVRACLGFLFNNLSNK